MVEITVKKRQIQNVVDFDFYYNTTVAVILNFSMKEPGIYWLLFPVNASLRRRLQNQTINKTLKQLAV